MAVRAEKLAKANNNRQASVPQGHLNLAQLPKGRKARVCSLSETGKDLQKLLIFGITPGQSVLVIQQYPTIVVEVGHTVVALDRQVASKVLVKPL
ncbi:MAG: ferrous iron transport protein A [Firmicutes bacterium]|nr:ferrous iron transport protein A [Bacillota bacterium]